MGLPGILDASRGLSKRHGGTWRASTQMSKQLSSCDGLRDAATWVASQRIATSTWRAGIGTSLQNQTEGTQTDESIRRLLQNAATKCWYGWLQRRLKRPGVKNVWQYGFHRLSSEISHGTVIERNFDSKAVITATKSAPVRVLQVRVDPFKKSSVLRQVQAANQTARHPVAPAPLLHLRRSRAVPTFPTSWSALGSRLTGLQDHSARTNV
jgi:hypothetical protein